MLAADASPPLAPRTAERAARPFVPAGTHAEGRHGVRPLADLLEPRLAPSRSPPPRAMPPGAVAAWACLLLGLGALSWVPASLWPRAGLPAWPAVSLGLLAMLLCWGRGGALLRVAGGLCGLLAAAGGAAQIGVLWAAAWGLSYM